jgi:hypothetical protein
MKAWRAAKFIMLLWIGSVDTDKDTVQACLPKIP